MCSTVYQLLSTEQLQHWDEAEQEYYSEEITYQVSIACISYSVKVIY